MLTEKGKNEALVLGTIIVMLDHGCLEKDIAEDLGISRMEVAQKIAKIATIMDEYLDYEDD